MLYCNEKTDYNCVFNDCIVSSSAQSFTLKGVVVNEKDEPYISVKVQLKGLEEVTTITNFDGEFTITTPDTKKYNVIVFTPINGYIQEYRINPRENYIRIMIKRKLAELKEPFIHGFPDTKVLSVQEAIQQLYADTIIKVEYAYKKQQDEKEKSIVYIINGIAYGNNHSILNSFDTNAIEKIDVVKRDTIIGKMKYVSIFLVELKDKTYKPQVITLDSLVRKHTDINDEPTIFCVNNTLVIKDSKQYLIDERSVQRIVVDKIQNPKDGSDLMVIKVIIKEYPEKKKCE